MVQGVPEHQKIFVTVWRRIGQKAVKKATKKGDDEQPTMSFLKFYHSEEINGAKLKWSWKNYTYTVDLTKVRKFDAKNRPMLDFELEHSIPIILGSPDNLPEDDSSEQFDALLEKGVLGAILTVATKLKADSPTWIQILAGFGIGVMVTLALVHFGVFGNIVAPPTPVSSGGISAGGGA